MMRGRDVERFLEGQALRNPRKALEVAREAARLIAKRQAQGLAARGHGHSLNVLTELFVKAVGVEPQCESAAVLEAWDALIHLALDVEGSVPKLTDGDLLTPALNHPAGRMTGAMLKRAFPDQVRRGSGIQEVIRSRIEGLLDSAKPGGLAARTLVLSRLWLFHIVDPTWTSSRLVPCLDWSRGEAAAAWQAYLWNARFDDSLFDAIRGPFIAASEHAKDLDRSLEAYCGCLVSAALDADGMLSVEESRRCLRSLTHEGRSHVAWIMWRRLEDSGERRESLWEDRIGPWIDQAWPKSTDAKHPRTSDRLAQVAVASGDEFVRAVNTVVPVIGPAEDLWFAAHALRKNYESEGIRSITSRFPSAVVDLMNGLYPVGDVANNPKEHLRIVLQAARDAGGPVVQNSAVCERLWSRVNV